MVILDRYHWQQFKVRMANGFHQDFSILRAGQEKRRSRHTRPLKESLRIELTKVTKGKLELITDG